MVDSVPFILESILYKEKLKSNPTLIHAVINLIVGIFYFFNIHEDSKMAKTSKASKSSKVKAKPAIEASKATKVSKTIKAKPAKNGAIKPTNKSVKITAPKAKKTGSRRMISDAQIVKLQKMYKAGKHSAQQLCDEFGISMATLFNYLKVSV